MFYEDEVIEGAQNFISEGDDYDMMKGREIHSKYLYYIGQNYYKNLQSKIDYYNNLLNELNF
jgi:hypothetical protein